MRTRLYLLAIFLLPFLSQTAAHADPNFRPVLVGSALLVYATNPENRVYFCDYTFTVAYEDFGEHKVKDYTGPPLEVGAKVKDSLVLNSQQTWVRPQLRSFKTTCVGRDVAPPASYSCGSGSLKVNILGPAKDTIQIVGPRGEIIFTDPINDGENLNCSDDIFLTSEIVVVRHGRLRDLVRMYGMIRNKAGNAVRAHRASFVERDGDHHDILVTQTNDFIVVFGRLDDLKRRFCHTTSGWKSSQGARDGEPPACQFDHPGDTVP